MAEMLHSKPRPVGTERIANFSYEARLRLCNWPITYPKYKLFWIRRAAQHYLETVVNLRPDALNVVNRVRPKKLD